MDNKQLLTLKKMEDYRVKSLELIDEIEKLKEKLEDYDVGEENYDTLQAAGVRIEMNKKIDALKKGTLLAIIFGVILMIATIVVGINSEKMYLVAAGIYLVAPLGFLVVKVPFIIIRKAKKAAIEKEYRPLIEKAEKEDEKEECRYKADCEKKKKELESKYGPEIKAKEELVEKYNDEFDEITLISYSDLEEDPMIINKMIKLIERGEASNVKECYKIFERQRQAEERAAEERRRNSPGSVYIVIGEKNTYSGAYQTPRNNVVIDGIEYGPASVNGKSFKLNPGLHTMRIQVQFLTSSVNSIYETEAIQFELDGGSEKYFKCVVGGYGSISVSEQSYPPVF